MGPSRVTKMDGQIRVVRVTKAAIKHPMEGPDSPIRSVRMNKKEINRF